MHYLWRNLLRVNKRADALAMLIQVINLLLEANQEAGRDTNTRIYVYASSTVRCCGGHLLISFPNTSAKAISVPYASTIRPSYISIPAVSSSHLGYAESLPPMTA